MIKNKKQSKKAKKASILTKINQKILFCLLWLKNDENIENNQNVVKISRFNYNFILSVLILSLMINLFIFCAWLIYQIDPYSRQQVINLIFH